MEEDAECIMSQPRFLIICTGYNCEEFVKPCINSINAQTYKNFEVSFVDDGSTDNSVAEFKKIDSEITFEFKHYKRARNKGTYYAREEAIAWAKNYDIIVMLDMDDALMPHALERAAMEYEKKNILMTYGNYQYSNGTVCPVRLEYSELIHMTRDYRADGTWRCTHLRTFKRELHEALPKWDLTQAEINSYPDVELLFSMLEMSGKDRIGVIHDPIYIYNTSNPISTLKRFGKDYAGYNEICRRPKRDLL